MTIVIMGILLSIATSSWFGIVESRRVDSATNQLAADMRLAHSSATNRLAPAKIVFNRTGAAVTCGSSQADYCLVQPTSSGTVKNISRYLPDSDYPNDPADPPKRLVKLVSQSIPVDASGTTSTIQFNSNGSAETLGSAVTNPVITVRVESDSASATCAASHAKPCHDVALTPATSRVKID
jgi:Tfp pilus assembly protein FimT